MAKELEQHVFVYIQSIVIVYEMVILSSEQCIRVLIVLHGVGSAIVSCYMYVYVFGISSTVFSSLSCFIVLCKGTVHTTSVMQYIF